MSENKLVAELREGCPELVARCHFARAAAADEIERLEKEVAVAQQHEDEVIVSHMNFIEYGKVLEAERDEWKESNRLSAADAVANAKERDRLRDLFNDYGQHAPGCNAPHGDYGCKCGYEQALAEAKQ